MASPFLANLALGYVKQTQANQKEQLDRQYAEESERRKMELDVEHQKRLQDLAFESLMQKTVVQKGLNQQTNARIADQYAQIAHTTTDPIARKQALKWASVYAGAGDMDQPQVQTLGKNLSPEKASEVSVQELEFRRKQANEALFEDKLTELGNLDPSQLEQDPKAKQRTFLALAKGLDSDYVKKLHEHFDAFFTKPVTQKMPDYLKNADVQYRTLYSKYMSQRSAVIQGKADPSDLVALEGQIDQLAESLNSWARENGFPEQYVSFEPGEEGEPGQAIAPKKKTILEATRYVPSPSAKSVVPSMTWRARADQIRQQFPQASPEDVLNQLQKEGYEVTK